MLRSEVRPVLGPSRASLVRVASARQFSHCKSY